ECALAIGEGRVGGSTLLRRVGIWDEEPPGGLGGRPDGPHLHAKSDSLPRSRRSAAGPLPRTLGRRAGLQWSTAAIRHPPAPHRDDRLGAAQTMVPAIHRGP